jgi:hypothetical protein
MGPEETALRLCEKANVRMPRPAKEGREDASHHPAAAGFTNYRSFDAQFVEYI